MENADAVLEAIGLVKDESGWRYSTDADGYSILVAADHGKPLRADYGDDIQVHHRSVLRLDKPENLVVLECVIRLLEAGYKPKSIELEYDWRVGHGSGGRLDILLRDLRRKPYAMIECKVWGSEYTKARNRMLEDGGQLLSYFVQDRDARGLYLYASRQSGTEIVHLAEFIDTSGLTGSNLDELFRSWDGKLLRFGILEPGAKLYDASVRNLHFGQLRDLDHETGRGLFDSIAAVLRRQVISDKANAFDKIFNLFVCKITDEDEKEENPDADLDFQVKTEDDDDALLDRLGNLYRRGMANYLGLALVDGFYSPTAPFQFIDVYDDLTHARNAEIVREVVQLLQVFRIKYSSKHQFLGDFFEGLLNTGVKQEAGQFFTPVPLAKFMIRSLPIEAIVKDNIKGGSSSVLPYVIDYACGAGHFLTEAIDEIQHRVLDGFDYEKVVGKAKSQLKAHAEHYLWAREYIYGIDKDTRLAKAAKIATFLNGDGDGTIISGDGLDDFFSSHQYVGKLRTKAATAFNEGFDVVISNPPYAISNFRRDIRNGSQSFTLYQYLTAQSSEIECLFVERTAQLLKPGGVAAVLFPLSLLNSGHDIYVKTRALLLTHFEIIALVELRDRTFAATSTTTVASFLRRRDPSSLSAAATLLQRLGDGTPADESLLTFVSSHPEVAARAKKLTADLEADEIIALASENELVAVAAALLMDQNTETVIGFSGEGREQEAFLGYRMSSRRGSEGLHEIRTDGSISSMLFAADEPLAEDKVSTHIRQCFEGVAQGIPDALGSHLKRVPRSHIIEPEGAVVVNPSSLFVKEAQLESYSPFGDFIDLLPHKTMALGSWVNSGKLKHVSGAQYDKSVESPSPTTTAVLTAGNLKLDTHGFDLASMRYLTVTLESEMKPQKGDVVISIASGSLKHLGKVVQVEEPPDAYIGGFLAILRPKTLAIGRVVYYNLCSIRFRKFVAGMKDQNINNLTKGVLLGFDLFIPEDIKAFDKLAKEKEKARKKALRLLENL